MFFVLALNNFSFFLNIQRQPGRRTPVLKNILLISFIFFNYKVFSNINSNTVVLK